MAELLLEQGLALEADTQALQAQQLLSGLRLPDLTIRVEAVLLQIHLLRGVYVDTGQLEQWEYLADGITSLTRIQVLRAQIMADIISEQSTKVLDRISSLESLMENLPLVHYLPLQLFLAEALVACGEFQKADVLARSVLPLATKLSLIGYQGNISRILGQIQLFVGTLDRAQDLIEQSIQMLVRIRSPRQLAKSHLALARTLERTGFAKDSASVKTQISKVQQCMATGNFKLLVL